MTRRSATYYRVVMAALLGWWLTSSDTGIRADQPASMVDVPAVWRRPPGDGYHWYRCAIKFPAQWQATDVQLLVEGVDDARQFYFDGKLVGALGEMPPRYRSGLGQDGRFTIPNEAIRPDTFQWLAVRIYHHQGRTNFNVAAPAVVGDKLALHLAGKWQYLAGDDPSLAIGPEGAAIPDTVRYERVQPTDEVLRQLKRLANDDGPLSPAQSLARFQLADDLALDLVLSEPTIGQPLSMKFDERGRLWVVQYLQYPNPAGLKMVSRDQFLRTVYDKLPPAPPNHFPGLDKITIHADTDGDGELDKTTTFVDGLNIATSIALDRDGVWVLNPPHLLFYPDRDHDDHPDGDPEVHLSGFGLEDTHSVVNSLRWGPDGWLYAAQGSTVTANIVRPGVDEQPIRSMGQLIWRYRPSDRRYEVFAEGGGNTFGVEFDLQGRVFSGHNGGNTRGFHYVQGGYYLKGFGKHGNLSNPYVFGYFDSMAHHDVPRFTHTFIVYEADALPQHYHGRLFGIAPLQSHVVMSQIESDGSSVKTRDLGNPLTSADSWFRPVDIQVGPDGNIYIADFYEQRIDHASHYQGRVDRESGRIYRLRAKGSARSPVTDLFQASSSELVSQLAHPNKWVRQTAVRLIGQRQDRSVLTLLSQRLAQADAPDSLESLWALHQLGGLTPNVAISLLRHANPFVRLWTVRLLCDEGHVSDSIAQQLAELARSESDVLVRSQLASSARRLPTASCLAIVGELVRHEEDANDIHLPLLLWWALEAKFDEVDQVIEFVEEEQLWDVAIIRDHLLQRIMRRLASTGKQVDLQRCASLLRQAPSPVHVQRLMSGLEQALEGRSLERIPDELAIQLARFGGGSLSLRVRQGDASAINTALELIGNQQVPAAQRLEMIRLLGQIKQPPAVEVLLEVARQENDASIRCAALNSLQAYDDPRIGLQITRMYARLPADVQEVAQSSLVSRSDWATHLLTALQRGEIDRQQLPRRLVHRLLLLDDDKIQQQVERLWGRVAPSDSQALREQVRQLAEVIHQGSGNPYEGKNLFAAHCAKCHVLFAEGGNIGPDLTSYKRDDLQFMLMNVVNPSLEIREGYENHVLHLNDGRTLSGFVTDRNEQVIVIKAADGQSSVVNAGDVEEIARLDRSLMPEDILSTFTAQQVRDLFAYLRSSQPLP